MNLADSPVDVTIVGAGLAGLTLAMQLNRANPGLAITVLERSQLPPPPAAHKVGESTVEIGARYLSHTLGLKSLLEETQLRKFGLRFFFGSGDRTDLAGADELGGSDYFATVGYQLDRGIFEADLARLLLQRGVDIRAGCHVHSATVSKDGGAHTVRVRSDGRDDTVRCRWLIDASSRFGLLKRNLNLARPNSHHVCAAWFRLDCEIAVDHWSSDPAWGARCNGLPRRLSTNHLLGSGYWAWIIPLPNGRTSIGLVADPVEHPLDTFNTFEKFVAWSREHQPMLAMHIQDNESSVMDFHYLSHLALNCKSVWSADCWALTGESGVFADPFYSPGMDYIGIGNTFICDLVTGARVDRDRQLHATVYENIYRSFFISTMSLYQQQYVGFGDTRLMALKSTWDYAYYWSVLAWMFFRDVLTDIPFMKACEPELHRVFLLNSEMQARFRKRAAERRNSPGRGRFIDQKAIPLLNDLNAALFKPDSASLQDLQDGRRQLEALATVLNDVLGLKQGHPGSHCSLLGDLAQRLA